MFQPLPRIEAVVGSAWLLPLLGPFSHQALNAITTATATAILISRFPALPCFHLPLPPHCCRVQAESGITGSDVSLLNFVVSDGRSLIATRYVSNTAEAPASLYYAEGSAYEREHLTGEVSLKYSAAAKALHGEEGMMEGAAGARSRQVTGKGRRGCGVAAGAGLGGWQWQRQPAAAAAVQGRSVTLQAITLCVCVCVCVCVRALNCPCCFACCCRGG
jgi:hypothetical protein